jgi:16S rRNA (guanine527-N7)-methyltransferase
MTAALRQRLRDGLDQLGLSVPDVQIAQFLEYLRLINKWNKVYNLTAVRDLDEMLTHHLFDCLAVINPLRREMLGRQPAEILDVGSGAGLPGIAIAICCPEIKVDCVDAVTKKAAFIQQVAAELQLANLRGLHGRVEELQHRYGVVACRAFASLADFVERTDSTLADDGVWLAMKGKTPTAEVSALPLGVEVFHVEQLEVPELLAERCIVWMKRRAVT